MNIQWYPGHMTKARRMMQEDIKLIDIVIELVDSRIPFSSKNPDIDELAKNKYRLILLNKSDLADDAVTTKWENYYKNKDFAVAKINAHGSVEDSGSFQGHKSDMQRQDLRKVLCKISAEDTWHRTCCTSVHKPGKCCVFSG